MPTKPKPSKDYPDSYFKVLEYFAEGKEEVRVTLIYKEAVSRRHHFYRFFRALAIDYNKDLYTQDMSNLANTVVISISPGSARGEEEVEIVFSINPIEKAFRSPEKDVSKVEEKAINPEETYDTSEIERLIAEKGEE